MILTIVVFVAVLALLIFVHEIGHYTTAKIFKVKAEEFGFGLPPRLFGWTKKNGKRKFFWGNKEVEKLESEDTVWSINWLPLGGFVKIKGEDGENREADSFALQKAWKRTIILASGVFMNLVLAVVLLSAVLMIGAPQVIDNENQSAQDAKIQILQVLPDSPAALAGLKTGDVILKVDDFNPAETSQVADYVADKSDQTVNLTIDRYGEELSLSLIPKINADLGQAQMGVSLIKAGIVSYPWYEAIWRGLKWTISMTGMILVAFYQVIKNLIVGLPAGIEVAGPIGIAAITGQAARMGLVYVMQFAAMLSINLAIINILPFPALDGGRILFIIIEKIRRRPVSQKIESIIHAVGFTVLIGLMLFVTGRDIFNVSDLMKNLFG